MLDLNFQSLIRFINQFHTLALYKKLKCIITYSEIFLFFLTFNFCRFCVVIRVFSSPPQRPMTSHFEGFSIPDFIHYIYFPILVLEKEPVFSFLMFSPKQRNYWYHFYNVFGMTRSLIEPGTSRTWSQHSTTRLSRKWSVRYISRCLCVISGMLDVRWSVTCWIVCDKHCTFPVWS